MRTKIQQQRQQQRQWRVADAADAVTPAAVDGSDQNEKNINERKE